MLSNVLVSRKMIEGIIDNELIDCEFIFEDGTIITSENIEEFKKSHQKWYDEAFENYIILHNYNPEYVNGELLYREDF